MAYDKVIDSAFLDDGLTAIADKIREKGGTTDALVFPNDFVTAIDEIEGGSVPKKYIVTASEVQIATGSHVLAAYGGNYAGTVYGTLGDWNYTDTFTVNAVGITYAQSTVENYKTDNLATNGYLDYITGGDGTAAAVYYTRYDVTKLASATKTYVEDYSGEYPDGTYEFASDGNIYYYEGTAVKDTTLLKTVEGSETIDLKASTLKGITAIRDYAFYYYTKLNSIEIPSNILSVGKYSFYYSSVQSVVLNNGVTTIKDYAFRNCKSLKSIVIPNTVSSLGQYTFAACTALESVTLSESVETLSNSVFSGCAALKSIKIPSSVQRIYSSAFENCTSMEYYDFTEHTSVPTLGSTSAFTSIPTTCEIRVPTALYNEWISASNWSTYASNIVAV